MAKTAEQIAAEISPVQRVALQVLAPHYLQNRGLDFHDFENEAKSRASAAKIKGRLRIADDPLFECYEHPREIGTFIALTPLGNEVAKVLQKGQSNV